jgi:hypothetical protein
MWVLLYVLRGDVHVLLPDRKDGQSRCRNGAVFVITPEDMGHQDPIQLSNPPIWRVEEAGTSVRVF